MADLQEILGRVIRRERQGRDMTIKELGDKAGLSEIYVGEIERGQKYPSAKVLESLANALELDVADLLEFMAEEMRREREPQMTQAIGFIIPSAPGQPSRLAVKKIVNMLDENDVESVADFSAFLLSRHGAFTAPQQENATRVLQPEQMVTMNQPPMMLAPGVPDVVAMGFGRGRTPIPPYSAPVEPQTPAPYNSYDELPEWLTDTLSDEDKTSRHGGTH